MPAETVRRLVIATGNPGKLRELASLLHPLGWNLQAQSEFAVEAIEETGSTFIENALLKARHAAQLSGLAALADDSGIVVDALAGEPGIRSARYAGEPADDAANNRKLLQALEGLAPEQRGAHFYCAMVLMRHAEDPAPLVATGIWQGRILDQPRGAGGFGYDPLFWLPDRGCSSAELPAEVKNRLSHRGQALRSLVAQLRQLSI